MKVLTSSEEESSSSLSIYKYVWTNVELPCRGSTYQFLGLSSGNSGNQADVLPTNATWLGLQVLKSRCTRWPVLDVWYDDHSLIEDWYGIWWSIKIIRESLWYDLTGFRDLTSLPRKLWAGWEQKMTNLLIMCFFFGTPPPGESCVTSLRADFGNGLLYAFPFLRVSHVD